MARKASLEARIGLNSSAFTRGLAGLRRSAARFAAGFGRAIASAGATLLKLGVAGVAAATAGLAVLIKKTATYGDVIDKMSKRTGTSVEFLQKLKHAAELGGSSLESMEKGIRTLAKSTAEAGDGIATYSDEFDKLGVSVRNTEGNLKSTEDIFVEVAEALAKVENSTERVAIAQALLGRSGTQVLAIMADGAKGFAEAMQEAEDLGLIMSQQDISNAAKMNDELTRTKGLLGGLGRGFAARFLPAVNAALIAFRGKIKALQDEGIFAKFTVNVEKGAAMLFAAGEAFSKSTNKLSTIGSVLLLAFQAGSKIFVLELKKVFQKTKLGRSVVGKADPNENVGNIVSDFKGGLNDILQEMGSGVVSDGNFTDLVLKYQQLIDDARAKIAKVGAKDSNRNTGGVRVRPGDLDENDKPFLPTQKRDANGEIMEVKLAEGEKLQDVRGQEKLAEDNAPLERSFSDLRRIGANVIAGAKGNNVPEKQLGVLEKMHKAMMELVAVEKSKTGDRGAQF